MGPSPGPNNGGLSYKGRHEQLLTENERRLHTDLQHGRDSEWNHFPASSLRNSGNNLTPWAKLGTELGLSVGGKGKKGGEDSVGWIWTRATDWGPIETHIHVVRPVRAWALLLPGPATPCSPNERHLQLRGHKSTVISKVRECVKAKQHRMWGSFNAPGGWGWRLAGPFLVFPIFSCAPFWRLSKRKRWGTDDIASC